MANVYKYDLIRTVDGARIHTVQANDVDMSRGEGCFYFFILNNRAIAIVPSAGLLVQQEA